MSYVHKIVGVFVVVSMLLPTLGLAEEEKIILKVWDQWEYYGQTAAGPAIEKIHAEYQQTHPNVILVRSVFGGGWPVRHALEKAFESDEVPDVFYSWPSGAGITVFANAGYIADLTPYAEQYNWKERLPEWAILRNSYQGKLYAYPWEQDLEYVYYNTRIFKELGLDVPQNFDDVLNWCDVASSAGYIPISLGNHETLWPAVNMFTDMVALTGGRQLGLDILQGRKQWNTPEVRDALEKMLEMVKHQCFSPGFHDMKTYDDALMDFYAGDATSIWTGTWVIHTIVDNLREEELDIFYFPQIYPDKPQASHMSEGSAYYIAAQSEVKDVAAEYIDFVTHPRWLQTWIQDGYTIPIQKTPVNYADFGVQAVIAKAFQQGQTMQDHHVDAFHTTAPPRVTAVLYQKMPEVLTGKLSIEEFLNEVDEQMAIAASKNENWAP